MDDILASNRIICIKPGASAAVAKTNFKFHSTKALKDANILYRQDRRSWCYPHVRIFYDLISRLHEYAYVDPHTVHVEEYRLLTTQSEIVHSNSQPSLQDARCIKERIDYTSITLNGQWRPNNNPSTQHFVSAHNIAYIATYIPILLLLIGLAPFLFYAYTTLCSFGAVHLYLILSMLVHIKFTVHVFESG